MTVTSIVNEYSGIEDVAGVMDKLNGAEKEKGVLSRRVADFSRENEGLKGEIERIKISQLSSNN